jgi:hypothetical protein
LAATLMGPSSVTTNHEFILLETNYKVYAYTCKSFIDSLE